jgi:N-acetylmuramoyl-L-alanine amidase
VILACIIGCAAPPKTRIDRIYTGLSEALPRLDPSILQGRKILIDPGHGGLFRGTVGQDSLEEARVNLGVSLYLWGLLNEAGAEASLTRSAEKDFLTGTDSSLVFDLQARVEMACSLEPDIFVSIHHNAQSKRNPDFNQVETYYRAGDPASLDLAVAVHRHLMRNLGIAEGEVRQGNYYVLRNVEMPAIIGESSYLTHPTVEDNLKLSNKQKLEAEAYFLGILDYFHRGIPRLRRLSPVDTALTTVPAIVFQTEDSGGLGIDPDAVHMSINRREVSPVFDRATGNITYRLGWDAPNGAYALSLTVRNLLGNSSHEAKYDFTIDFPPHTAVFEPYPTTAPMQGGIIRMQCRLLDRRGLPVCDGTRVAVAAQGGEPQREVVVSGGRIEYPVVAQPGNGNVQSEVTCRGKRFTFDIQRASTAEPPVRGIFIENAINSVPVTNASIVRAGSVLQSGSTAGLYLVPAGADSDGIHIQAPGFQPAVVDGSVDTVSLSPWFDGKLFGKRFLLDPQGGVTAGAGRLGLSGAYVNLQVARYLSAYLQTAGASVRLTRHSEEIRTPQDIVTMANRFHADRYIEIRRGCSPADDGRMVRTYHFPGSGLGPDFAGNISESLSDMLSLPPAPPEELVTYPLQQTACPAIVIETPSIGDIDEELLLGEAWYQRLQAYGIFIGILRHFEMSQSCSLLVTVSEENDASNWLAVVDGTWKLMTNPNGEAMFHALAAGIHTIEMQRGPLTLSRRIELTSGLLNEIHFRPETE